MILAVGPAVLKTATATTFVIFEKYNEQLIDVEIHVIPFLKRFNISKSFCSLRVGFNNAIYNASKLCLTV